MISTSDGPKQGVNNGHGYILAPYTLEIGSPARDFRSTEGVPFLECRFENIFFGDFLRKCFFTFLNTGKRW